MNKNYIITVLLSLLLSSSLFGVSFISDPKLETAIRMELKKGGDDPLAPAELLNIFSLDLSNAGITSLKGIQFCKNLTVLNVSGNKVTNVTYLDRLKNLTKLEISNTGLEDISFTDKMTSLEYLDISDNAINDITLVSNMTRLKTLKASGNRIADVTPVAACAKLTYLDLSKNSIRTVTPIGSCKSLRTVILAYNDIAALTNFDALRKVVYLNVSYNKLRGISSVRNMKFLKKAAFHYNDITDLFPLSELTGIRVLYINKNRIRDISFLRGLKNLEYLNCSKNVIRSIGKLSDCTKLTILNIAENRLTSLKGIEALANLAILDVSGNQIKDISPLEFLQKIGEMDLKGNSENVDLAINDNQITNLTPLLKNIGLGEGDSVNISNNPISEKEKSVASLEAKGVLIVNFEIESPGILPPDGVVQLNAFKAVGVERLDFTSECTWTILEGQEFAEFVPEAPGLLKNKNTSGAVKTVLIKASVSRKGFKAEDTAEVRVQDDPHLKQFLLDGADKLREDGFYDYVAIAEWIGRPKQVLRKDVAWEVISGKEYVHFDETRLGRLVNDNKTGGQQKAVIACHIHFEGKVTKLEKHIQVMDSPFISGFEIIGPDEIPSETGFEYKAMLKWTGKEDQDVTENVEWTILKGEPHAYFDFVVKGKVLSQNKTGQEHALVLKAVYTFRLVRKEAIRNIRLTDDPYAVSLNIQGGDTLAEDGSVQLKAQVVKSDGSTLDTTDKTEWSILQGIDLGNFDKEKPGLLKNTNITGTAASLSIKAVYKGKKKTVSSEKTLTAEDTPYIKGISIEGPETLDEGGFSNLKINAEWAGIAAEQTLPEAAWKILKGKDHARFDDEVPGMIHNINKTGSAQTVVIRAELTSGGKNLGAEKLISLADNPFLADVEVKGPGYILEGAYARFSLWAVYQGKANEDMSIVAKWRVVEGTEHAQFDGDTNGKLQNINTTGAKQKIVIAGAYSDGGITKEATREVVLLDTPFVQGISVEGGDEITPTGTLSLKAFIAWSDGKKVDVTSKVTWELIQPATAAQLSADIPGMLKNTNRTGNVGSVTVLAFYEALKETVFVEKKISVQPMPFITQIVISGPESIAAGEKGIFKAEAVWEGREKEDITAKAVWSVTSLGKPGTFEKPGVLLNNTDTALNEEIGIAVEIEGVIGQKKGEAKVLLKGVPVEQDEPKEEPKEEKPAEPAEAEEVKPAEEAAPKEEKVEETPAEEQPVAEPEKAEEEPAEAEEKEDGEAVEQPAEEDKEETPAEEVKEEEQPAEGEKEEAPAEAEEKEEQPAAEPEKAEEAPAEEVKEEEQPAEGEKGEAPAEAEEKEEQPAAEPEKAAEEEEPAEAEEKENGEAEEQPAEEDKEEAPAEEVKEEEQPAEGEKGDAPAEAEEKEEQPAAEPEKAAEEEPAEAEEKEEGEAEEQPAEGEKEEAPAEADEKEDQGEKEAEEDEDKAEDDQEEDDDDGLDLDNLEIVE